MWQGKAIGATIGIFAGGPVGAAVGAVIGHLYDRQTAEARASLLGAPSGSVQETFFRATFLAMGHVAKADGHVSEAEIRAARSIMDEMRLGESEVELAIQLYRRGKAHGYPLEDVIGDLNGKLQGRPDLKGMFVQIQLTTALRSGKVEPAARAIIARMGEWLQLSRFDVLQLEALLRLQQSRIVRSEGGQRVQQAYDVLGVSPASTDEEVTKAYRRLMNESHPDKLVARGLPESMTKLAEEKTRQIRAAYELVRESRRSA